MSQTGEQWWKNQCWQVWLDEHAEQIKELVLLTWGTSRKEALAEGDAKLREFGRRLRQLVADSDQWRKLHGICLDADLHPLSALADLMDPPEEAR